ncbi:non-ribosomal peptide synthetase [Streptomyces sp. NPDC046985]|uniref:non-ribosomal peptide synthetase n=1 Tax=Streptomyces sp. NPDC046985 TaxID=3155377 RepID=UPI0033D61B3E
MAPLTPYGTPPTAPAAPGSAEHGAPLPAGPLPPVHELVGRIAAQSPDRPAVRSGASGVSYGELSAWADRTAALLAEAGVGHGALVGVLAEPSAAMVAAVLAVLRCGAAYVPVDPAHPDRRIAAVLKDAQVSAVVTAGTAGERLAGLGVPVIAADGAAATAGGGPEGGDPAAHRPLAAPVREHDAAYLIYTSGSTGEPKGVVVEHGQLAASTAARRMVYPGRPVFLLVSPLAFDSSVAGLWGALTAGGCLVVAGADDVRDPERLVELVERRRVTHLLCVPSLYSVLLDAAARLGAARLRTLETVIVAGEPLPPELVERHFALRAGPAALVNEYGPTEATVWASYHRFEAPGPVSIGRPVPGARLYVLDDELRPAPPGGEGELFIGGAGVTRGYHGRPEATAAAFLRDPFADSPTARMYRTGDLVRRQPDGSLVFLGRRDHQVKIRGHRVELGAVEAHLTELPGVREAAAVVDRAGGTLTAFVVAPARADADDLRRRLAARLPAAMVPARITVLDDFPRTVNGKTDRTALRERADAERAAATERLGRTAVSARAAASSRAASPRAAESAVPAESAVAAQGARAAESALAAAGARTAEGDLTDRVTAAWAEVLQTAPVPLDVNFFDLGGHSLAMYQLREALERHTGRRPSMIALFEHTTVASQTAMLRCGSDQATEHERDARARQAAARRARALRAARRHTRQEEAS